MDRQQKIERIASKGHVARISNLKVTHKRIHPDYACEPCDGKLGETGKLELLKVVPKSGEGPFFMARWDQKAEHLDIDMKNAANSAIRSFKKNRHGYRGHHTMRASNPNERHRRHPQASVCAPAFQAVGTPSSGPSRFCRRQNRFRPSVSNLSPTGC